MESQAVAEGMRNLEGLEAKNVTLKQRDDNKMSFGRKPPGDVLADGRIEDFDEKSNQARGQTLGMMSGMTAGSGTMGTATTGVRGSGLASYDSQVRNSQKGSHSMRPQVRGAAEYNSAVGGSRLKYDQIPD